MRDYLMPQEDYRSTVTQEILDRKAAILATPVGAGMDRLDHLIRIMDAAGDGYISRTELRVAMRTNIEVVNTMRKVAMMQPLLGLAHVGAPRAGDRSTQGRGARRTSLLRRRTLSWSRSQSYHSRSRRRRPAVAAMPRRAEPDRPAAGASGGGSCATAGHRATRRPSTLKSLSSLV